MKSKLSTLEVVLILTGLILTGCGTTTAQPTELPVAPPEPQAARDAALAYVSERFGEQAPAPGMIWTEERITPEGLVGSETLQYTAEDWMVTISYPVVAPEAVVYQVVVANQTTGFQWEGEVDAALQVTEQQVTEAGAIANPASKHCVDLGYELEIRTDESGNQYGVCVFPDGSECEEWAFLRGECTYQEE